MIRVKWKTREVTDAIRRMRAHRGSFAPVYRELKRPLRADLSLHAQRERSESGKWPHRAPATGERYERRVGQSQRVRGGGAGPRRRKLIRRRSKKILGRLPAATTFRATHGALQAISKVPWSAVHNEGGRVGRGARVPARPYLFISDRFAGYAVERMAEFVVREFGR